jgi:hypothetical protein
VRITFVLADSDVTTVEAEPGYFLMAVAIRNGACACATCRVHVDEASS